MGRLDGAAGKVEAGHPASLVLLSKHRKGEVQMRASWIFSKNDVIANVGIFIAGLFVYAIGGRWPDLLITIVVMRGGIQILRDSS